jgi:MtN3 and saliva related transmembrane protein
LLVEPLFIEPWRGRRAPPLEYPATGASIGRTEDNGAMQLTSLDALGFVAGALTTAAFVPQVVKSWTSRDLSGISLRMYSLFTTGVALWLLYGIALGSWPVIVCNAITLVLAGGVLYLKVSHR